MPGSHNEGQKVSKKTTQTKENKCVNKAFSHVTEARQLVAVRNLFYAMHWNDGTNLS